MKVDDVAAELDCSKAHAYVVMRKLNAELSKQGYIIAKKFAKRLDKYTQ